MNKETQARNSNLLLSDVINVNFHDLIIFY